MLFNLAQNIFAQSAEAEPIISLTMRMLFAGVTGFVLAMISGPKFIAWLKNKQVGQQIRELGPESHYSKKGTPTMGGGFLILSWFVSTLLWADWQNHALWIALGVTGGYALIGWIDDYRKIIKKNHKGLSAKQKLIAQFFIAFIAMLLIFLMAKSPLETSLTLPYFKSFVLPLGVLYIAFGVVVIVGSSNAVNLTDGLDGLAIIPTVLVGAGLGLLAYFMSQPGYAQSFQLIHLQYATELCIFCAALIGSGLGFLWFNSYPAQVFMGDVGSLSLGAALGVIAVLLKQEFTLFIMGGVFVIETISVILQVLSFKSTGKRIFKMAPIHHHFELSGWPEPKVIVRFWILSLALVLIGLSTLTI